MIITIPCDSQNNGGNTMQGLNQTLFGRYYDSSSIKVLLSGAVGGTDYQTLKGSDLAVYQVPTSTQLRIIGIKSTAYHSSGDGSETFIIGYGDTSVDPSASAPTNLVSITTTNDFVNYLSGKDRYYSCDIIVPTGKYPVVGAYAANVTASYEFYCIEEAV